MLNYWITWITTERHTMNMHNPAHPGELLTGWLDDLGVSVPSILAVTAAA